LTNNTFPIYIKNKKGLNLNYRIEDIPLEGVVLEGELEKGWLEKSLQYGEAFPASSASKTNYRLHVSRSSTTIFVKGTIKTNIEIPCSRCTERFVLPLTPEFRFSLIPVLQEYTTPYEKELLREDLDTEFYEGETIDLGKIIQNQVLLTTPIKPLCQEDCQGLCPICGINRNQETCSCTVEKPGDPRLSALKNLLK
jgi:uncharacterized protein